VAIAISEAVRAQAEDAFWTGPEPPRELGIERVTTPRYALTMMSVPSWNMVGRLRFEAAETEAAVAEVRATLRARGRPQAAWLVGPRTPPDARRRLVELGMTPYTDPPLEPHSSCMALERPPDAGAVDHVVVTRCETLEDFETAAQVTIEAFGIPEEAQRGMRTTFETRLELQREGRPFVWEYLAAIDGEAVGFGRARMFDTGINLMGAGVLPHARGQGVYRALVAARWEEAVARGTPALTVQAGAMSRPVLEQLGFVTVAEVDVLCDRV